MNSFRKMYKSTIVKILMIGFILSSTLLCSAGVARDRFVHSTQCPEDKVSVKNIGGGAFEAEGCGKKQTYVCIEAQWNTICRAEPSL
ncbi:hypothetical protein [Leptospira alstonii]|uniref:Uncharacterized protein n=2 Tax=Leptospira alstonii TaxID=28452 RepID=M6CTS2_9LEPT|nr:hypothetical protein [Leptospira alstonii]EMJ93891.1 hypothetical protein LEP1GSC194_2890 [Leptospira alstonii serovar Sichuan str. 79601]EQA80164.1 hypothetical protein LEP1GSC193_4466 [Leptospira alstonii serovar Pingchang str. 80-412]